jgi:tetratricopeptide (TPR) repeat protein
MKRSFRQTAGNFLLLAAVGLLASCALWKEPAFEPGLRISRQFLAAGDFQRAIDSFQSTFLRYPKEALVRHNYIRALEQMKRDADRAFWGGNFFAAEKTYSILLENYPRFKELEPGIPFRPPFLERRIRECRTILAEERAQKSLQAGNFQNAFDAYKITGAEGIKNPDLRASYQYVLEEVKRLADAAMAGHDFKRAGAGYAALIKEYAPAREAGQPLPFSLQSLEEGLNDCRTQITRKGLEEYRKGNLSAAIVLWRGLLEFDPENSEIRKAVETAREQIRKLKKGAPKG